MKNNGICIFLPISDDMRNEFGEIFRLTTFGESHGAAIGGVIDGMPAGIAVDVEAVQRELDRRRPGQSAIVTARNEKDRVKILSGLFEGKTTGTPIGFVIENEDHHSADYGNIAKCFRPSHADYTFVGTRNGGACGGWSVCPPGAFAAWHQCGCLHLAGG